MKLGKDTVVSIQKYTETFRNKAKTCLIVNTVSKIEKNEENTTPENTDFQRGIFTKFPQHENTHKPNKNNAELPSAENDIKKSIALFWEKFGTCNFLDDDFLEGCVFFDENLFYEVQTDVFNSMIFESGILKSNCFGVDFKARKVWNFCGFDTEYADPFSFNPDDHDMSDDVKGEEIIKPVMSGNEKHSLLSMQFSRKVGLYRFNTIVFVKDSARFELRKLIKRVDQFLRKVFYLKDFMFKTRYFAHFGVVDFSKFEGVLSRYNLDHGVITNVRKSLITRVPLKLYDYNYDVSHKKKFYAEVDFRDTMLLDSPKSLRKLGDELGFKKIFIGDYIEKMDKFMNDDLDSFYDYSIRDSEITLELADNYYADELFSGYFPVTLSSLGAKYAKNTIKEHFGLNDEEFDWNFKGKFKVKMFNKTQSFYNSVVEHYITTMSRYYGGGRNETFLHGIFKGAFIDVDGKSFYPSSACMIPFVNLSEVPYTNYYGIVNDRTFDFERVEVGMCQINFDYPKTCNITGIPVFTPVNGLIYPRSGRAVWCSVQEIKSAYKNGARIELITGFVFKEHSHLENPFEVVYDKLFEAREEAIKIFGKGSPQEKKQKTINNSIYGKSGQGIKGKKSYNFISDSSEEIVESVISSGVYANSITAIARATITELMLLFSRYSKNFEIGNVVTDGFLLKTDKFYSDEELNKILYDNLENGQYPNLKLFVKQLEKKAEGKKVKVLAQKHKGNLALFIKTRGAVVLDENSDSSEDVQISLTGFKFSKQMGMESDINKAKFIIDLYIKRTGRIKVEIKDVMGAKSYRRGKSEATKVVYKKYSMNYDYKRKSVEEEEIYNTFRFKTVPWDSIEQFYANKEKMESNKDIQIKSFKDLKKIDSIEVLKKNFQMKIQKKYTNRQVFEKFLFALAKTKKLCFNGEIVKSFDDLYKIYEFNNIEPEFSRDFYRKQKITDNFQFSVDKNLDFARKLLEINLDGSFKILSKKELEKV